MNGLPHVDVLRESNDDLRQEIIRLRESNADLIARHAEDTQEAVAAERERCAKIADKWAKSVSCTPGEVCDHIRTGTEIAARIREGK